MSRNPLFHKGFISGVGIYRFLMPAPFPCYGNFTLRLLIMEDITDKETPHAPRNY